MKITGNAMFSFLMSTKNHRNPLPASKMAGRANGGGQLSPAQPPRCLMTAMGLTAADINRDNDEARGGTEFNQMLPLPIMRRMSVEAFNGLVKGLTGHDISEWDSLPRAEYLNELTIRDSSRSVNQTIEDISRKFSELREGITEKFGDDEDEMYRHLGELNIAFEVALKKSTAIITLGAHERSAMLMFNSREELRAYREGTDAGRARVRRDFEAQVHAQNRFNSNMLGMVKAYNQSMMRHMDNFFEAFISSIKTNDFDTAFAESMALLNGSESRSINDMSFSDAGKIRDTFFAGGSMFFDEAGQSTASLNSIINNQSISSAVRQTIASRFGLRGGNTP